MVDDGDVDIECANSSKDLAIYYLPSTPPSLRVGARVKLAQLNTVDIKCDGARDITTRPCRKHPIR
eukprot:scaffold97820_cov56-Attheya_sp.AAC.2